MGSSSSSSSGDVINDSSVNMQNGGTVVQMGTGRPDGKSGTSGANYGETGGGGTTNYTYSVLDGGAIESAFDFAEIQTEQAFDFGQKMGTSALDVVERNSLDSMDFSENVLSETMEFNGDVLDEVQRTSKAYQDNVDKQLGAIQEFATTLKAGDSALMKEIMVYLIAAVAIVVIGVIIAKVVKK